MKKYKHNPYTPGTQNFMILNHLYTKGSITQVEAEAVYKIRRLASRISEIKNDGFQINNLLKHDMMGQRYARYSLK